MRVSFSKREKRYIWRIRSRAKHPEWIEQDRERTGKASNNILFRQFRLLPDNLREINDIYKFHRRVNESTRP